MQEGEEKPKAQQKQQIHVKGAIRHAEKRRISTCAFADRIAKVSINSYHNCVPLQWREQNQQICLATFVAYWKELDDDCKGDDTCFQVIGLGVGTKYLSQKILFEDEASETHYGVRIRDSHAEILARRAMRKYFLNVMNRIYDKHHAAENDKVEMNCSSKNNEFLLLEFDSDKQTFFMKENVTIHMYTSSTPCGNSSIKKFAQMSKETFQSHLKPNQWPKDKHESIKAHSIHLGQFALLVKKDSSILPKNEKDNDIEIQPPLSKKQKSWPSVVSDEWCPPG